MGKIFNILIIFSLFSLYHCSENRFKTNDLPTIDINIGEISELALSEIIDKIELVCLETKPETLLQTINKVSISDGDLFLTDGKNLLRFDKNGKFVNKIGSIGKGYGEYLMVYDFCISTQQQCVFVLSYMKIQKFTFNGQFIGEDYFSGFPERIEANGHNIWVTKTYFAVKQSDSKSHNITRLVKYNIESLKVMDSIQVCDVALVQGFGYTNKSPGYYSFTSSGLYYYYPMPLIEPFLRDTIYQLTDRKLVATLKLNFGQKVNDLVAIQKQERDVLPYKKFRINGNYVTDRFIFTHYAVENTEYLVCFDRKKSSVINIKEGLTDDIHSTGKLIVKPLNQLNWMYFVKDGFEVSGKINNVTENSNPVVFLIKLKE